MNLREEVLLEHSKRQALRIAGYVGDDPDRFSELAELVLVHEAVVAQRAAYAMLYCLDGSPELGLPYLSRFLDHAMDPPHVAVRRNVLRWLQSIDIPEDLEGRVYDVCWEFVNSTKEEIAVRVFSLTVVANIARKYPELITEVLVIARELLDNESPALRNRAGKVVKMLSS